MLLVSVETHTVILVLDYVVLPYLWPNSGSILVKIIE